MLKRGVFVVLWVVIAQSMLAAQAPDPDALVASVEKAATALAKAGAKIQKEDYDAALTELQSAIFQVPAARLKVTAAPFDAKGNSYTFTVTSSDTAVPFTGTVVYSIEDSQDLKGDFTKVEAALKAKTLGASLTYRITKRATGYRVNGLTCEVGIGLGNEDAL